MCVATHRPRDPGWLPVAQPMVHPIFVLGPDFTIVGCQWEKIIINVGSTSGLCLRGTRRTVRIGAPEDKIVGGARRGRSRDGQRLVGRRSRLQRWWYGRSCATEARVLIAYRDHAKDDKASFDRNPARARQQFSTACGIVFCEWQDSLLLNLIDCHRVHRLRSIAALPLRGDHSSTLRVRKNPATSTRGRVCG